MGLWHKCRCGAVIPQGLKVCASCADGQNAGQSRHMEYNRFRRDKKAAEFYTSQGWRNARENALKLYDGIDIYAYYIQHRVIAADMVHHIVELEDDWTKRLDMTNLIPLSNGNHGIISALYKKDETTKAETQRLLREIIAEHWKEAGGIEKVLQGVF